MEASWKLGLEEELLCPICLNVFAEPVQLPCKHNFCTSCISEAWAKEETAVRCPECNHDYDQKPTLEKNFKLANIANRFNALNTDKAPTLLHCVLCRRGPPLPVRKVCLRCKEPCCQTHIQTHLQLPSTAPGHLLVDAEELSAWTCPTHEQYRLFHCTEEQVALCFYCCISSCTKRGHTVCDVDTQHVNIKTMLMRQQNKLEGRVQNIDEQITKLESDRTVMKDAVSELKECLRDQYQKMHALLETSQTDTLNVLERSFHKYVRKNSQQALQLNKQRQEANKLRSSLQTFAQRAYSINMMKNTKPYQLLRDRTISHLSKTLHPLTIGKLNHHHVFSDLAAKENNLKKILEVPIQVVPILEVDQSQSNSVQPGATSGHSKRRYDESNIESSASRDSPSLLFKNSFLSNGRLQSPSLFPSRGLMEDHHNRHGHFLNTSTHGVGPSSSSGHHSGAVVSHITDGGASQPGMFDRSKLVIRSQNNFCCSRDSTAHSSYLRGDAFGSPSSQTLQHLPMTGLLDVSRTHRHHDLFGLYSHPSTPHYVSK
ncbi:E3 ubiquitin-protein ligase TRIM8-like isoform X1 [Synchiropus splendidus]|uniref:E3 ubiquitin-protein ligase TRIM8-like isoform X1 n=1 Tax=Synchiropus splendidus TaxID=270530 RepID=UPI00237E29CE|nr:E3 ubiquitin-protein ligase TRIM8-like isoform X1 [Synchiropus splendidus]XP_053731716.1 E3 ubiquitin-protein ligase TRIM8-like isoform X1 [Synchiropus splendidus]XP_053731717.1 E3 ubiquitin-protein ligase TRIM8-like isoform X1 [Synchiropus splendidus]XP_053731718.1 E3 ubiquitin-protein ligase TRIM8-like isoform X1 [Synchiropus splendidus]